MYQLHWSFLNDFRSDSQLKMKSAPEENISLTPVIKLLLFYCFWVKLSSVEEESVRWEDLSVEDEWMRRGREEEEEETAWGAGLGSVLLRLAFQSSREHQEVKGPTQRASQTEIIDYNKAAAVLVNNNVRFY